MRVLRFQLSLYSALFEFRARNIYKWPVNGQCPNSLHGDLTGQTFVDLAGHVDQSNSIVMKIK